MHKTTISMSKNSIKGKEDYNTNKNKHNNNISNKIRSFVSPYPYPGSVASDLWASFLRCYAATSAEVQLVFFVSLLKW